jgi:HK97 family phage portal protein
MLKKALEYLVRKSGFASPEKWLLDALNTNETALGVTITNEAALTCSTVMSCCRILSESIASLPIFVFRRDGEWKLKASNHPLYRVLHKKPNPFMTAFHWKQKVVIDILLRGNHFSVVDRNEAGEVTALWPCSPDTVTIHSDSGELFYELATTKGRVRFDYGQILHIRGLTLDGITGVSVLRYAREAVGLDLSMQFGAAALHKNRSLPSLVVKVAQALKPEQRDAIRKTFEEMISGKNLGRVLMAEGGADVQRLALSPEDTQYVQSRGFNVADICRFFRVPAHMVGSAERLAYASSEVEVLSFLTFTLSPWFKLIEEELQAILLPDSEEYFCEFDANAMARGDQASRYASYAIGLERGFLEIEDVRQWENLGPLRRPAAPQPVTEGNNAIT